MSLHHSDLSLSLTSSLSLSFCWSCLLTTQSLKGNREDKDKDEINIEIKMQIKMRIKIKVMMKIGCEVAAGLAASWPHPRLTTFDGKCCPPSAIHLMRKLSFWYFFSLYFVF